jgi:hypothetical protein
MRALTDDRDAQVSRFGHLHVRERRFSDATPRRPGEIGAPEYSKH